MADLWGTGALPAEDFGLICEGDPGSDWYVAGGSIGCDRWYADGRRAEGARTAVIRDLSTGRRILAFLWRYRDDDRHRTLGSWSRGEAGHAFALSVRRAALEGWPWYCSDDDP